MKRKNLIYVLVLTLLLSLLAGCGGNEKTVQVNEPNETGGGVEEPSKPVKDSVIIAIGADIATLDAHFSASATSYEVFINLYDPLIELDEVSREFVPCLAEDWEIGEDNATYIFKLKKGVKFHNGEELKASDVVFSLNRAKTSPYQASQTSQIKDVTEIDEYTVQVTVTEPFAPFLLSMSYISILNEKAVTESGEAYGENPVGTGPYKYVRHDIGERVVLERFDEYFRGPASIKNVEYQVITDANTTVIALETGEVDFAYVIPMISRQSIVDNPELTTHEFESITFNYSIMNNEIEPFNNLLVRQAINYAVDKEAIIQIAEEGMGKVTDSIFNKHIFGYSENVKGYEYNPEKAKELLAEAGYPDGFEITLKTMESQKKVAQIIQEDLNKIGITANVEVCEKNAYIQDIIGGNYEMGNLGITVGTDAEFFSIAFHSTGGLNVSKYNNPRVDALFEEAKTILDKNERIARYEELSQILVDDAVVVPLYFPTKAYAAHKDLKIRYIDSGGTAKLIDMSWQ